MNAVLVLTTVHSCVLTPRDPSHVAACLDSHWLVMKDPATVWLHYSPLYCGTPLLVATNGNYHFV